MKVVVLTTSYPRDADDVAGTFVRDGVEALRAEGVDVRVVSPAAFRHYGIAYGAGIVNNLRRSPWKLLVVPLFLASFARAARRASRDADVVHAHWLPSALPALATGKPIVLQLWGSDVALARHVRPLARWLLRRARIVVCASSALAEEARALGAVDVRLIPSGVSIPEVVGAPDEPPHVLYVGRLSEEKGVRELAEAARGLPLVVVGDGPLRSLFPQAVGFVPPHELGRGTSGRRSSSSRRGGRATAWSPGRRWRTAVRSWRRQSVGSSTPWRTASPACSCRPGIPSRFGVGSRSSSRDEALRRRLGENAARLAIRRFSVAAAAGATVELYGNVLRADDADRGR